jgi:branched-chain amino acid transport system substrate-binding protein
MREDSNGGGSDVKNIAKVGRLLPIVTTLLLLFGAAASSQDIKDINVALIMPQSGPVMVNVDPAVKSIRMAIDEVNAKGIMVGGQKYRFNVSWFDEECKPPVAINATRAALSQVKPLHVVWTAMCSSSALATAPILRESKAVVLNSVSGTSGFAGPEGNPYLFKIKEEFEWRSRDLTKYLAARGLKNGAIIAVNSDWGEEASRTFKKYAAENGLNILQTINYDEHTEEFVSLLAKARQANPDFIFEASQLLDEQVAFLRAYRQLGLKIQLAGESTWTEDVAEKAGWDLIDGMLTASAWVPSDQRPAVNNYLAKYRQAFKVTPGFNGPPSYDMVHMTATAFEKAGSLDTEALRNVVRNTRFENLVYGNGHLQFNSAGQAEFPVLVTVFDAKQKLRVLAPPAK